MVITSLKVSLRLQCNNLELSTFRNAAQVHSIRAQLHNCLTRRKGQPSLYQHQISPERTRNGSVKDTQEDDADLAHSTQTDSFLAGWHAPERDHWNGMNE